MKLQSIFTTPEVIPLPVIDVIDVIESRLLELGYFRQTVQQANIQVAFDTGKDTTLAQVITFLNLIKNMALTAEDKSAVVKEHQRSEGDTGSPEVQIALMTARIQDLTGHFKTHIHDHHSRQGLLRLVNHRRKLLSYLRKSDVERYRALIAKLGLRK